MLDDRKTELVKRLSSKPGYAGKVAAKCIECIYDPLSGNGHWRQQVAACAIYSRDSPQACRVLLLSYYEMLAKQNGQNGSTTWLYR